MRRHFAVAGLSVFALLPLAAGAHYIDTLPARPSIALSRNGVRLAEAVSPKQLKITLLAQLAAFNAHPVSGHLDKNGRDRLKAWVWTYLSRAAIRTYHLTHDPRLIEAVLLGFEKFVAEAHAHDSTGGFGWYTRDSKENASYQEVPVTGLIIAPIVDMIMLAETDSDLATIIQRRRDDLLRTVELSVAHFDARYLEQDGLGFFLDHNGVDVLPLNLSSVYARPLLGLWKLTGNRDYGRKVAGIARTWKAALDVSAGGVTWPYTPQPGDPKFRTGVRERMIKAAAGIEFPLAAYRAGLVLTAEDIKTIAGIPYTTLLQQIDSEHVNLRRYIDSGSQDYFEPGTRDGQHMLELAAWYSYACADENLKPMLDSILFGLDRKFYLHNHLATMAFAERLTAAQNPKGCQIDIRPGLQAAH